MERLVSKKVYKLAVKRGFDLHVCRCGGFPECICHIKLPMQSMIQTWIRDTYGISVEINYRTFGVESCNGWYYVFMNFIKGDRIGSRENGKNFFSGYNTYEDALEAGLYVALEFIRNNMKIK